MKPDNQYAFETFGRWNPDDVRMFGEISSDFVKGYTRLVQSGIPENSIAVVMLSAAVNFYEIFEMSAGLPDTLRALADELEGGRDAA